MPQTLEAYLVHGAVDTAACAIAEIIVNLANAAVDLHRTIAERCVPESGTGFAVNANASGETQKPLDIFADQIFFEAARISPVRIYGSEERDSPVVIDGSAAIALAIDPLDGSSNIETNIAVGTIFSLLPVKPDFFGAPASAFERPGIDQLAAGFFMYGAQLLLVLTLGKGTKTFAHTKGQGFVMVAEKPEIPQQASEYAINASNRKHWKPHVRRYIEDLEAGEQGPRGRVFGMRYVGSLVADAYRILQRGGIFLYPDDNRDGYRKGRLRHVYEANPIAFCIEQAGGAATDGRYRIMDLKPAGLHARSPLIFGGGAEVALLPSYGSPFLEEA